MKYLDEYRDPDAAARYARLIAETVTRPWTLMEVCGGQTHSILRHGVDSMLPPDVSLLHGPGCPVCVTATNTIDTAIDLALRPGVTLCSFGDMLRVPGTRGDLLDARAKGGDVRMVYSPLDALALAHKLPDRQIVFLGIGFETTAPTTALTVHRARAEGIENFSLLAAHVRVPPALRALLDAPDASIDGFLAAGHVCTVMGYGEYHPIAAEYGVPIVVTGFEPVDLLQGILMCLRQLETGRAEVENQYTRCVKAEGNPTARSLLRNVFHHVDRRWRGLGKIAHSGLGLAEQYEHFDAERRFGVVDRETDLERSSQCISGDVLRGKCKPTDCAAFGAACTPEHPLGATMVSTEGACSAYYRYRRIAASAEAPA